MPNEELHHLRDGCVVLYKRDNSEVWQVRFKLFDMRWHRFTTKHRELAYAKKVAAEMNDRARFIEEMGIPLSTKRFGAVAEQCLTMLEREIEQGLRPMTNKDYQRVIRRYLIPFFGKYNLTSLDSNLVREFEIWRNQKIGHMPIASTLMTHSASYNRVIELAMDKGWISQQFNLPRLSRRGAKSKARPGFTAEEVQQLFLCMPAWCESGHMHTGRQIKLLLRDYVELLLTTGMRCGKESMNVLWQHIEWHTNKGQRYLCTWVSGKKGGGWLIAKLRAVVALERLSMRQESIGMPKRLFAAVALIKDMSSGQPCTINS